MATSAGTRNVFPNFSVSDTQYRRLMNEWMRRIHQGIFPGDVSVPGTLSASAVNVTGTLSVSGTVVAANIAKAWTKFQATSPPALITNFNVSSISRSATGIYRVNFTTGFTDANYTANIQAWNISKIQSVSATSSNIKFTLCHDGGTAAESAFVHAIFYR